jgi:hypothetical protein
MVHRKHKRSSSKRRIFSSKRRTAVKKTLTKGVSIVKNTSKKYMPKVKAGLEDVGATVTTTAKKSVPMLQQASRKFFSLFGIGKSKSRKHRKM